MSIHALMQRNKEGERVVFLPTRDQLLARIAELESLVSALRVNADEREKHIEELRRLRARD